jgi:hypothetical protein
VDRVRRTAGQSIVFPRLAERLLLMMRCLECVTGGVVGRIRESSRTCLRTDIRLEFLQTADFRKPSCRRTSRPKYRTTHHRTRAAQFLDRLRIFLRFVRKSCYMPYRKAPPRVVFFSRKRILLDSSWPYLQGGGQNGNPVTSVIGAA